MTEARSQPEQSNGVELPESGTFVLSFKWTRSGRASVVKVKGACSGGLPPVGESVAAVYELIPGGDAWVFREFDAGLTASVQLDEAGALRQVRLDDGGSIFISSVGREIIEGASKTPTSSVYFSLHKDERGSFFRAIDTPYYYLAGAMKKLDIRDEWTGEFAAAADAVISSGATLLAHDRLYTLWQAVRNVAHLNAPIVEIGVLRGGSTKFMAHAQRCFGKTGGIFACDTFEGHAKVEPGRDGKHQVGTFGDRVRLEFVRALLGDEPSVSIVVGDIEKMASSIDADEVALVHVDVDVYPTTKFCLEYFAPRLAKGGAFVIDDYAVTSCPGVVDAVSEFLATVPPGEFSFTHLLSGQALLQKIA